MGDESPRDDLHFCAECGISREPRRHVVLAAGLALAFVLFAILPFLVADLWWFVALPAAEIVLFLFLGGAGLLLSPWWTCPSCRVWRLAPAESLRWTRIHRVFDRLVRYLGIPAAFLGCVWVVAAVSGRPNPGGGEGVLLSLCWGVAWAVILRLRFPPRRSRVLDVYRARRDRRRAGRRDSPPSSRGNSGRETPGS